MRILRIATVSTVGIALAIAFANPASATGTLDQQYSIDAGSGTLVDDLDAAGQVFTAGLTGQLEQVDVKVMYLATPGPDLTMTIKATTAGMPSGAALATASVLRTATQSSPNWVTFTFSSPISVVAGTQYAILLNTTTAVPAGFSWEDGFTSLYAGGNRLVSNNGGSTWVVTGGTSGDFRTYVTTSDAGPTPPPVMQQFSMPSSGTCDAAAPVVLNWGGASSGSWGNSWAEWANGGKGGPVCTRTLSYSNALGHWVAS